MESAIYVVATPIGNLSDITLRALDVLKGVDVVAAEDTRHTRKLMDHHGIRAKLIALHDHNEKHKSDEIIDLVKNGQSLALVSDAGTPLISDPGYTLISRAKKAQLKVVPVPGASAFVTALSASGMASDRFTFEGFLPVKAKAKADAFERLSSEQRTLIFYESPRRILDTLSVARQILGDREACIARELTKRYETIVKADLSELYEFVSSSDSQQKGEFVLIISGADNDKSSLGDEEKIKLLSRLLDELPPKKASAVVADLYGGSKKDIYALALSLKAV